MVGWEWLIVAFWCGWIANPICGAVQAVVGNAWRKYRDQDKI